MIRRVFAALALALVLGGLGLSAPSTTLAATNPTDPDGNLITTNLAGRPVNGYAFDGTAGSRCAVWDPGVNGYVNYHGMGHGIAYAKVGGSIVLLYPFHGMNDSSFIGKLVQGRTSTGGCSTIGYFWGQGTSNGDVCKPTDSTNCSGSDHDLGVIMLYQGNWPASLNHIYRGDVPGDDFWTISEPATNTLRCADLVAAPNGWTVYQNWQSSPTTTYAYSTALTTSLDPLHKLLDNVTYGNNSATCQILTDRVSHADGCTEGPPAQPPFCSRDSGSPWVALYNTHTVFGFSSGSVSIGGGPYYISVTPFYEGISVLYAYWQAQGSTAFLCTTADCSS